MKAPLVPVNNFYSIKTFPDDSIEMFEVVLSDICQGYAGRGARAHAMV